MKTKILHDVSEAYEIKEELGSGGFSTVCRGIDRSDGSEWALKLIPRQVYLKNKGMLENEVGVMQGLNYPGVVLLREVIETKKHLCIVMDLLRGGELFDRIVSRSKYSENDAKKVARELLQTIRYIHSHQVVHRDLKPENLVFRSKADDSDLVLTDFGFAAIIANGKRLSQGCGTPEYVAPEILDQKPYDEKVDIWSAGVITYILLCGFPPFYGDNDDELYQKICTCNYSFLSPYWDPVSDDAKGFIRVLLSPSPTQRPSAEEALQHPWLQNQGDQSADLGKALTELQKFNAIRKLRKGVLAVIAANKMSKAAKESPSFFGLLTGVFI